MNLSLTLYPPGGGVPPRPEHQAIIATVIPTYLCPSDRAAPMANANNCSNAVPAAVNRFVASRGRLWAGQAYENTAYNHFFAPNSERYDCYFWVAGGFKAARSNHTAGVQTTLLDGSVRFVAETIDITVWRAVATRGGTEVINCTQW